MLACRTQLVRTVAEQLGIAHVRVTGRPEFMRKSNPNTMPYGQVVRAARLEIVAPSAASPAAFTYALFGVDTLVASTCVVENV